MKNLVPTFEDFLNEAKFNVDEDNYEKIFAKVKKGDKISIELDNYEVDVIEKSDFSKSKPKSYVTSFAGTHTLTIIEPTKVIFSDIFDDEIEATVTTHPDDKKKYLCFVKEF